MSWTNAQELFETDGVFDYQPAQCRAVAAIIIFLQRARGYAVEPEQMDHEQSDALVDLGPQIAVGWIERIVEVEHPGIDMVEFVDDR